MTSTTKTGMKLSEQQHDVVERVLTHRRSSGKTIDVRGVAVPDNLTVVSAGAGSGKTHVTVATALELVAAAGARLDEFVLITFTNKAADELRERFEKELERLAASPDLEVAKFWRGQLELLSGAYIGTIHSFCRHLLASYAPLLDLPREAEPSFSSQVLRDSLEEVFEEHNEKIEDLLRRQAKPQQKRRYELEAFLARIYNAIRNMGYEPVDVLQWTTAQPEGESKVLHEDLLHILALVHDEVEGRKRDNHLIDAHDMLQRTDDLLTDRKEARHALGRIESRYSYLFVDEFQDTDRTQKRIVDALRPHLEHVLLVGDRKQAIYGFRAADASILDELANETSTRDPLPMTISRRATQRLIHAQAALFSSIGTVYPGMDQPLSSHENTPHGAPNLRPIQYVACAQDQDVHAVAAAIIKRLLGKTLVDVKKGTERKIQPGDIVILTRRNAEARRWAAALTALGFEARAETGGRFFDAPEIIGTFRFLRFIQSPNEANLAIALETPYLAHLDSKPEIAMTVDGGNSYLMRWLRTRHGAEWKKIQEIRDASREESVPRLLSRLYDTFEIRGRLQEDTQALLNLERLRERARNLMANEQALTLRQFLDWLQISYETDAEEPEAILPQADERVTPYIRTMVIHQAKGLEFPIVILPTSERINRERPESGEEKGDLFRIVTPPQDNEYSADAQGLSVHMPSLNASFPPSVVQAWRRGTEDRRREEIRILYVAATRATNAIVALGNHHTRVLPVDSQWYAWQHEFLRAEDGVTRAGGEYDFKRLER